MPKTAEYDFDMIRRADHFLVSVFLGVGKYHTEKFDDLAAAREGSKRMAAKINNGRRGMIYAVVPEGRSTFVPDTYQPENLIDEEKTMTTETNLTAKEVAQLSAILTGDGSYKRSKSKDAAIKRFLNVAAETKAFGHEAAVNTLGMDFETASKTVRAIKAGVDEANAPAPKSEAAPKAAKPLGKRAEIQAAAERGEMPAAPDFSAKTHTRFRPKLAQVLELAEAGDLKGLKAFEINPVSSSPKAIVRYRDLCVTALEVKG